MGDDGRGKMYDVDALNWRQELAWRFNFLNACLHKQQQSGRLALNYCDRLSKLLFNNELMY